MRKKDAMVLFDVPEIRITHLIVLECPLINERRNVPREILGKIYPMSRGSCCSNWKEETFSSLFINLSIDYGFESREIAWKVWDELYKIDEWKEEMDKIYKQLQTSWI
jgi:hypothetical protein